MEPKRRSDHGRIHRELTSVADDGAQTADLGALLAADSSALPIVDTASTTARNRGPGRRR